MVLFFLFLLSFEIAVNKTEAEAKKVKVKSLLKTKGRPAGTPRAAPHIKLDQICYKSV